MSDKHDVNKLPVWARHRLQKLEADNRYMADKLAEGPENSDTFADPFSELSRPLGQGPTIRFTLDGKPAEDSRDYIEAYLDHDSKGEPFVRISSVEGLMFLPSSSNVAYVRTARRQ
jgi:hypothetical protein